MGKIKGKVTINKDDIAGKRYGKLLVIKHIKAYYDETSSGIRTRHKYLCQCDCGNLKEVARRNLLYGRTKSCGCNRGVKRWRSK